MTIAQAASSEALPRFVQIFARAAQRAIQSRLASAASYSIAGSLVSQALNMAALSATATMLGSEVFGKFTIVQNTTSMVGTLSGVGLGSAAMAYIPRFRVSDPARAAAVAATNSTLAWIAGLTLTLAFFAAAPLFASEILGDVDVTTDLRLASLAVVFQAVSSAQYGSLVGLEAFRALAAGNCTRGVLCLLAIPTAAWVWGLQGAIAALLATSAVMCAVNSILLRRELSRCGIQPSNGPCLAERGLFGSFSIPIVLSSIVVGPVTWFANALLVKQSGGYSELGVYAAAERWRLAIVFVPACLASVAMPRLSRSGICPNRFRSYVLTYGCLVFLLSGLLALPIFVLAPNIMGALGPGYAHGGPTLQLLAIAAVVVALNTALGQAMLSSDMVWTRFAVDAVLAGVFLVFSASLIPTWKSVGIAAAYLVAYSTAVFFLLASMTHVLRSNRRGGQ